MPLLSPQPCPDEACVPELHAHPLVLAQMLDELGGLDAATPETAEWLLCDPALTAHILASHPQALSRTEPPSLLEYLDGDDLKHWLVMAALKAQGRLPVASLAQDWHDSLSCACLCQGLARQLGYPDAREAYLAGLLHNLDRYAVTPRQPAPGFQRTAGMLASRARPALSAALRAQDEDSHRLSEALPLARLLRVARASTSGAGDAYRLAAALLPELAPDGLDAARRQAEQTVAGLEQRLAGNAIEPVQARLNTALEEYFLIEQVRNRLAGARTEAEVLDTALPLLERQPGIRQPVYLRHDRTGGTLAPLPGSRHPGLKIRLQDSNSAAAWAMSSRVPVVFSTLDSESVSLLDVQLAWQAGASAVVAIPVGESAIEGVLVGCAGRQQAVQLEQSAAYLSRLGRQIGRALMRTRAVSAAAGRTAESGIDQLRAQARQATHEINNPLGIARNYLAILAMKLEERGQDAEELGIIREELDRIPRLLQTLTGDGRAVPPNRESCDIGTLIQDLARVAESAIPPGKRIRVATRIEANLPVIRSDPGKLKQLLLNLILNAIEACPDDGLVGIEAYTIIDLRGAKQLLVAVRDNGAGIGPEKLARLFEPAGSDKGGRHAGLGLAIVKTLATELGMTVACRSDAQGTTFQVAATAV